MARIRSYQEHVDAATCVMCGERVFDVDELFHQGSVDGQPATVGVIIAAIVGHAQARHPEAVSQILDAADTLGMTDPTPLQE